MIQDDWCSMSKRTRKRYTPEFKREAVSLVTEHSYSKAEAGRSLDVNPNQIRSCNVLIKLLGMFLKILRISDTSQNGFQGIL